MEDSSSLPQRPSGICVGGLKSPPGKGQLTGGLWWPDLISSRQSVRSQRQEPAGVPGPHWAAELRGRAMPTTTSSMWDTLGREAQRQTLAYATWKPLLLHHYINAHTPEGAVFRMGEGHAVCNRGES